MQISPFWQQLKFAALYASAIENHLRSSAQSAFNCPRRLCASVPLWLKQGQFTSLPPTQT